MEIELTKDEKRLLGILYCEYAEKVKAGVDKNSANYFGDSDAINGKYRLDWSSDYASDVCWGLKSADYLCCFPGDNLANNVSLTRRAISHMENKFKNGLLRLLDFLLKFVP